MLVSWKVKGQLKSSKGILFRASVHVRKQLWLSQLERLSYKHENCMLLSCIMGNVGCKFVVCEPSNCVEVTSLLLLALVLHVPL